MAQIKAHQELGWGYLELRAVDGKLVTRMNNREFDPIYAAVTAAGLKVSCFSSGIANWAHPITGKLRPDTDELRRAIAHMRLCGTRYIRIMSYPNDKDHPIPEAEWRREAIRRVKRMVRIAEEYNVVLAHENCSGWGGISWENNLALIEAIDSPNFGVLFDTGNPPTYGKDTWEWYLKVRDRIIYVHIKDARLNLSHDPEQDVYTYAGEGDGCVRRVLADLVRRNWTGFVSTEPHLAAVIHTGQKAEPQALYDSYVEYGRKLMDLIKQIRAEA